jgi:hypothetical protein
MIHIPQGEQQLRAVRHDAFLEEYSLGRSAAPAAASSATVKARQEREARRRLTFAAVLLASPRPARGRVRYGSA